MKYKYLIFCLIILVLVAGSIVFMIVNTNDSLTISNHKFDIPRGYGVIESNNNSVTLSNDKNNTIKIIFEEDFKSDESLEKILINQSYSKINSEVYSVDDSQVSVQTFEDNKSSVYKIFHVEKNDLKYKIHFGLLKNENSDSFGSINTIISTMDKT